MRGDNANESVQSGESMKSWIKRLPAIALAQFSVSDQWSNRVDWSVWDRVPTVLVMGGQKAGHDAARWGIFLQQTFNPTYVPVPDHLQILKPEETVKIVAIATLPDVPQPFKWLFRSGFRKEVKNFGMALDYDGAISRVFGYDAGQKDPSLAILPAQGGSLREQAPVVLTGPSQDTDLQARVVAATRAFLIEPQK